jgi:heat shock protein HtpX
MEKADLTSFDIQTEIKETQVAELAEFLYQRLVFPRKNSVANVQRTTFENEHTLSFRVLDPQGEWHFDTETKIGKTVEVKIAPSYDPNPPEQALSQFKDDMFIAVESFEDQMRRRTIYFAWGEGIKVTPGKPPFRRRRILDRILFENMIFLFMLLLVFSVFLFFVLARFFPWLYVPIPLVAIQFLIVLVAPKLISRGADWTITEQNPNVHILTYTVPPEEAQIFREKLSKDTLLQIKTEIYQNTLAIKKPIDCQAAQDVFSKYGLTCGPENLSVKTVNVYRLVEEAARKFGLQVPKIVISNTVIPNAAATGPSPRLGLVLITTGILVQLQEDELLAVLGHEFGHLTGRDPVVLYGLVSAEYLFRFYVVLTFLGQYVFLFYLYFILILGVIFFIAKFFEARADLVSAIRIGTPQVLASALRKIGFKRLGIERSTSVRVQSWIGFDPHPPIYFRVDRLEKLRTPVRVRSPLLTSIKDCFRGLFASF